MSSTNTSDSVVQTVANSTLTFFKSTYEKFIFVLTLSILFISVITIADAVKSTIETYVPKTANKLVYKYLIGFIFIILGVVISLVFGGSKSFF